VFLHGQMEDLDDWRGLRPLEWLAPVKSLPDSGLAWLYVNGSPTFRSDAGGLLVQVRGGYLIKRVGECPSKL
jgi:hypothetical protein